jgi:predicted nucleotide-binding protein
MSKRVFVVHGHDEGSKHELELFLKELGLEPIVLRRKPDEGRTTIEKSEKHSDVSYAFVLLTPDDVGYSKSEDTKRDEKRVKELRARQNVIFEFGYFVGRLGRGRVRCLHKPGVSLPTDLSGVLYKELTGAIASRG